MRFASRKAVRRISTLTCLVLMAILVIGMGMVSGQEDLKLKTERNVDGTVRLTWKFVDDPTVDHYQVYWDTEEFETIDGMQAKAAVRGTVYTPDDLENDVRHYFAVTAVDGNGTVLAEGFDDITPREPHLKEVNFSLVMTLLVLTTIVFIIVLMKVPKWTQDQKGGV